MRFRKNTIFRVYLLVMCVSFTVAGFGALLGQRRFYVARLDLLDSRISTLSAAVVAATNSPASVASAPAPPVEPPSAKDPDPFWVEGHGYNKRYAYIDICFPDGYRARYYFKPDSSYQELVALNRRIRHDANLHRFVPLYDEDYLEI